MIMGWDIELCGGEQKAPSIYKAASLKSLITVKERKISLGDRIDIN